MKILITGGHLTPALAVIEEIKKQHPETEIVFVGRKYALDSEKTVSLEYKEILRHNIRFIPLQAGRLTRVLTLKTVRNFLRIPLGFLNAFQIIRSERPQIVLSFGGYIALPTIFWGKLFGADVYTHEQTVHPGLANRLIGKITKKNFVAFKEAANFFDRKKTVICGNPIRKSIFKVEKRPFVISKTKPVIYITGGSLGSHSINVHVKDIINDLLENYIVIHQIGETKEYHDYEDLTAQRNSMQKKLADNYFPVRHFFEDEIGYVYSQTDLLVGRSGANTFFETLATRIPALFIPLPWSSGREQQKHAEIFARHGIGEIFHQIEPSGKLFRLIKSMIANLDFYRKNFNSLSMEYKQDAGRIMVSEIFAGR